MELLLFDREEDALPACVIPIDPSANRTYRYWHAFVPGVKLGQLYAYRVKGPAAAATGLRFDASKTLLDPYGRGAVIPQGYTRCGGDRNTGPPMKSVVVDPHTYDWEGDAPLGLPFSRTIIYEMHVRGFTQHPNSGVGDARRGTYAGLIEKIPYLQQLGISAVELLPVFQFDAQDCPPGKTNYWGYAPISFFAPHQAFSSRRDSLGPVDEFRDMVKARLCESLGLAAFVPQSTENDCCDAFMRCDVSRIVDGEVCDIARWRVRYCTLSLHVPCRSAQMLAKHFITSSNGDFHRLLALRGSSTIRGRRSDAHVTRCSIEAQHLRFSKRYGKRRRSWRRSLPPMLAWSSRGH